MRNIGLGDRMKQYEQVTQVRLIRRMPVILRLDGKSFHRFTRGFEKPFDPVMLTAMQNTMQELCNCVEGCVLGYTQSDEISLVLCDYQQLDTEAWFGNKLQKLCSISASICTSAFQKYFREAASTLGYTDYLKRADQANFDSRAFNLPMEEVNNYFVWRQRDTKFHTGNCTSLFQPQAAERCQLQKSSGDAANRETGQLERISHFSETGVLLYQNAAAVEPRHTQ